MATQLQYRRPAVGSSRKHYTPLIVLQIFSGSLILTVAVLTIFMFILPAVYDWQPTMSHPSPLAYSPIYAIAAAGACLVLSFIIPEALLDSARRELKRDSAVELTGEIPFILMPCIFIRYALLAIVSMIGFVMAVFGATSVVFLPFALVSIVLMYVYFPTEPRMKSWLQH